MLLNNRLYFTLILALSMSFFSSCIKKPVFSGVENFNFTEQTETSIKADMNVQLRNDNAFALKAEALSYNIYINEKLVGKGQTISKVVLPAKQTASVANNVELMLVGLTDVFDYIMEVDSIPLDFDISGKFTRLNIPLNHRFRHYINKKEFISKLLNEDALKDSYQIKNVELVSGNLSTSELKLDVEFTNRFPLSFTVDSMNFDILPRAGDTEKVGAWRTRKPYQIPAQATVMISADVSLSNLNVITSLFSKLFSTDKSFYMKGEAYIKVVDKQIRLPLEKKIEMN